MFKNKDTSVKYLNPTLGWVLLQTYSSYYCGLCVVFAYFSQIRNGLSRKVPLVPSGRFVQVSTELSRFIPMIEVPKILPIPHPGTTPKGTHRPRTQQTWRTAVVLSFVVRKNSLKGVQPVRLPLLPSGSEF